MHLGVQRLLFSRTESRLAGAPDSVSILSHLCSIHAYTPLRNISSFVIVVVAILSMNGNKNSASFVFGDFVNLTGFPPAYAAIVGLLQAAFGMW